MTLKTAKVRDCNAAECAYNAKNKCHAVAITIGGDSSPLCNTSMKAAKKGGVPEIKARVGACKVENCQFNKSLECTAKCIRVEMHNAYAECTMFKQK